MGGYGGRALGPGVSSCAGFQLGVRDRGHDTNMNKNIAMCKQPLKKNTRQLKGASVLGENLDKDSKF